MSKDNKEYKHKLKANLTISHGDSDATVTIPFHHVWELIVNLCLEAFVPWYAHLKGMIKKL